MENVAQKGRDEYEYEPHWNRIRSADYYTSEYVLVTYCCEHGNKHSGSIQWGRGLYFLTR